MNNTDCGQLLDGGAWQKNGSLLGPSTQLVLGIGHCRMPSVLVPSVFVWEVLRTNARFYAFWKPPPMACSDLRLPYAKACKNNAEFVSCREASSLVAFAIPM